MTTGSDEETTPLESFAGKLCKHCRSEIENDASICIHCGKRQSLFVANLVTLSALSGGITIVIAALTYALVTLPEFFTEWLVRDEISVVAASVDEDTYFAVLRNNLSKDLYVDSFVAYFPTRSDPTSSFTVGISKVLSPNEIWTFETDNQDREEILSDCGSLTTVGRGHINEELLNRLQRFTISPMNTKCMLTRLVYPAEKFLGNIALHYGGSQNIVTIEHELYISYFSTRNGGRQLVQIDSFAAILADFRYRPDR